MLLRDSSISSESSGQGQGPGPARTRRRALIAGSAAVILAAGTAAVLIAVPASHPAAKHPVAAAASGAKSAHLAASSCSGPTGAAYVALPGYQAFDAVDTSNCKLIQQYNVGDREVPNTGTSDTSYDSSEE